MPPGAMEGSVDMTDPLTPADAARVLASASTYEHGLVQRTEGLTQMVWGIATAAIFVTYGFASRLDAAGWVYAVLWAPWVLAGSLTTMAMWRSAALSQPAGAPFDAPRGVVLRILALTALFAAVFFLVQPEGPTIPLAVVGGVWTLMALLNVFCASPLGRGLWAFAGLAFVATAAGLTLFEAPPDVSGVVAIVVAGAVPLATGLYQTLRG